MEEKNDEVGGWYEDGDLMVKGVTGSGVEQIFQLSMLCSSKDDRSVVTWVMRF